MTEKLLFPLLGLVIATGAVLRFTALDFGKGVPDPRPDELMAVSALEALDRGNLTPPVVLYGGGYFGPLRAYARLAEVTGDQAGVDTRLVARRWSAILAVGTLLIVFVIGRRLGGSRTGLIAAGLLAAAPLAVRDAHFAKADTAAAAACTLAVLALTRPAARTVSGGAAVGFGAALAVSTKACLGILPAAAAALLPVHGVAGRKGRNAVLAAATAGALGLVVLNLFVVTRPRETFVMAAALRRILMNTAWLPGNTVVPGPLRYHVTLSLRWGFGLIPALLAAPALGLGLARAGAGRLVAVAALGLWAQLLVSPMVLARFFLPVVPLLAVLEADLLVRAADRVIHRRATATLGLAVAVLVVLAEPFGSSVALVRRLGRTDTRALAADWIAANLPPDARIVSWGAPNPIADYGRPEVGGREVFVLLPPERWAAARVTHIVRHVYPLPYSDRALPKAAGTLIPLAVFDPFVPGAAVHPVLEPLDAFYLPLGRFGGVTRPGPRIEVYATPPAR